MADIHLCPHLPGVHCDHTNEPSYQECTECMKGILQVLKSWSGEDNCSIVEADKTKPKIAYICDRRACEKCSYPYCIHTLDISHAADFVKDGAGNFMEE